MARKFASTLHFDTFLRALFFSSLEVPLPPPLPLPRPLPKNFRYDDDSPFILTIDDYDIAKNDLDIRSVYRKVREIAWKLKKTLS